MSSGVVVRLPTSPKIARRGTEFPYPALGRVARGMAVSSDRLDVPMSADVPHLHLESGRSPADSDCIRRLLIDWQEERISRSECLDGIEAVKAFGGAQLGLF